MKIRKWILLGLWALSLTAISFFGGAVSYGLFWGVTLLPVISILYIICVYFRFKIYQEIESRNVVCGQPIPYFFVLRNEDRFAFSGISVRMFSSFSYVEELPENVEYELLPGDKFTYESKLVCKYRGEYEVGVKEVIVTDFLRLFRISYTLPGTIKALVLPRLIYLNELASIADLQALIHRESIAGAEPDVTVRDYAEGDPLKLIHWKSTAREQKLKTRIRIGEEKQGIAFFCDTKRYSKDIRDYLPLENKILETLLALGLFFAQKDIGFSVYYSQNGLKKNQVQNSRDFEGFYQETAQITFSEEENTGELLIQAFERGILRGNRVFFCVLHEIDDIIMGIIERMTADGMIAVVYAITDQVQERYVKLSSERRKVIVIPVEAKLEEWL